MQKRYFKARDKALPKGYDSKLEYRLHTTVLKDARHHPVKEDLIPYVIPHTYEYDFLLVVENTMYLIETKGRAVDSAELSKYNHVRKYLNDWHVFKESDCDSIEFLMIFENSSVPTPFAKKRKDGTKQTHGEWATKNGIKWLCEKCGDLKNITSSLELIQKFNEVNNG